MNRIFLRYCISLMLLVCVNVYLPLPVQAKSISLYGNWRAGLNGSDAEDSLNGLTDFRQRYDLRWFPNVTRKIDLNADFGYTNNWVEGQGTRQILNPIVNFGVTNDIFAFGFDTYMLLNYLESGPDRRTTAWNSDLASGWDNYLWPRLQFSAGQRQEDIKYDLSSRPDGDTLFSYGDVSVFWDGYKMNLYYNYYLSETDEKAQASIRDEERHTAQLRYTDSFWSDRVRFNFSQHYFQNTSEYTFEQGTNPLVLVPLPNAQAGNDFTPLIGALPGNAALVNGNYDAAAFVIQVQQPANLAVHTNFRTIDRIYVYTTKDNNLLVANTDAVTWALYSSNDGITWQLINPNVPSRFNTNEFRFEVVTGPVQDLFVKLVATGWIPAFDVEVTELEAYTRLQGGSDGNYVDEQVQHKTNVYLGVTPTTTTNFNYTFSLDQSDFTGRDTTETEQIVQTARFDWFFSRYFNPSVGFSDVIRNQSNAVDIENRSYNLSLRSTPIPTVDLTLSFVRGENFEDSELDTTNHNVNLSTLATLYPDLTTEFEIGWAMFESEKTVQESNSLYGRWVLRSRLRESLNVDFITEYSTYDSQFEIIPPGSLTHVAAFSESTGGSTGQSSLNVSWRVSDLLSCQLYGVTTYGDDIENVNNLVLTADYLVLRTSKTNLIVNYRFNSSNQDTINNFGFVWGWDLSNFFILRTTGNYVFTEGLNSWNLVTQLTAKF